LTGPFPPGAFAARFFAAVIRPPLLFFAIHALRHTAVTNVYRTSRDLFLAQRFARHVSPLTTTVYTHPSDEETSEKLKSLPC
jgi:integrase